MSLLFSNTALLFTCVKRLSADAPDTARPTFSIHLHWSCKKQMDYSNSRLLKFKFFVDRDLLGNLSCHGTCSEDQAGLKLRYAPKGVTTMEFLCALCMPGAQRSKELDPLKKDLQPIVSHISSPLSSFCKYFELNGIRHIFNVEIFYFLR